MSWHLRPTPHRSRRNPGSDGHWQDGIKRYEATAVFGVATDSLDADGAILDREPMEFSGDELRQVAKRFVGTISQIPPMVSAVKVGGRRLHELAREGVEVERAPRAVEIHSVEVGDVSPGPYPEAQLTVTCGSGTYIRTLADDMGQALGGRAHLTALRRTAIGPHNVSDAVAIEVLDELDDPAMVVVSMAEGLGDLGAITVDDPTAAGVGNGMVYPARSLDAENPGTYRLLDSVGNLLAVYVSDGRRAKPEVVVA
jgi:tRNA pseudouridine55 synthase